MYHFALRDSGKSIPVDEHRKDRGLRIADCGLSDSSSGTGNMATAPRPKLSQIIT
jgi:hypothetical protein